MIDVCCMTIIIVVIIFALLDLLRRPQRVRVVREPERVKLVQRCKHCGTLNDEKNHYCSYCGKRL